MEHYVVIKRNEPLIHGLYDYLNKNVFFFNLNTNFNLKNVKPKKSDTRAHTVCCFIYVKF